ncbi:hypothetical protein GCM10025886_01340 [Tetragenococcus halophilus subsp. flandriensis]|uniref:ImmA/IrrE family metallo-endopeptidase n=1 Tax=Tetragenococcus halophilus TaxID=51669 RepID=UPI0023EA02C2|nr:ImmA/IrrE family metallo-endopeptidase [Tetragenococcus halophilus]GMA06983.1 hypothetical protein GCM10025886_01340 [Tetragenococcus halophilus subsp. flandriensis]
MNELFKKLNKLGINLVEREMEKNGYYLPEAKIMFINESLTEEEKKYTIYHELAHHLDHSDYIALYRKPVYHYKMESEADDYAINQLIKEHDGVYNYSQLIDKFNISMGKDEKYHRRSK